MKDMIISFRSMINCKNKLKMKFIKILSILNYIQRINKFLNKSIKINKMKRIGI